jgi:hypothetical protein
MKASIIPEIKTDQVKVTRSLGRIARFRLPSGIIGMPATWVDRSSSRDDAAKYKDLQHFILFSPSECSCPTSLTLTLRSVY